MRKSPVLFPFRLFSRMVYAFCLTVAAFLLAACHDGVAAYAFHTLPEEGWDADDTLRFPVDTVTEDGYYALTVYLRTPISTPYPYREIILHVDREVCQPLPKDTAMVADTLQKKAVSSLPDAGHACSASVVVSDTLKLVLVSPSGETHGRGTSLLQYDCPCDTFSLKAGSKVSLNLRHLMRTSPLPGVHDVGICLRKVW